MCSVVSFLTWSALPNNKKNVADVPFFLVTIDQNSCATVRPLKDWEACQGNANKVSYFNTSYDN